MRGASRWTTTFRNLSPKKRACPSPQRRDQFTSGSIIFPPYSSILPLPEQISIWSDPKTIRARLILHERFPDRYECSVRVQSVGRPDVGVKRWLETTDRQSQHVSVITLGEIQKGIEMLADGKRRAQLEQWLKQDLEAWFSGRMLPVDRQVAGRWASLVAQGARAGRPLPTVDSLIAATALAYDLTIVRDRK